MKLKSILTTAAAFALTLQVSQAADMRLVGSGASFPFPIYSAWFKDFSRKTDGVSVDYQAKGSGAGIQDLINKTVDFAASDAAMTPDQIAKVGNGVVLLPMTAGEIVLAYNLPGQPKNLKLPRDVYPDIFLGKIARWNDPRITAANPSLKLPDLPITVVRRSDSSGTTFVFTKHLSRSAKRSPRKSAAGRQFSGQRATRWWPRQRTTASRRRSSRHPARSDISNTAMPS